MLRMIRPAAVMSELGAPEKAAVAEVTSPAGVALDEVRILVHGAGVNFAGTMLAAGIHQNPPALPFRPGLEVAGVIAEVADLRIGDRVQAAMSHGGFRKEVVVPALRAVPIPDTMDFSTAAAFPVSGRMEHTLRRACLARRAGARRVPRRARRVRQHR